MKLKLALLIGSSISVFLLLAISINGNSIVAFDTTIIHFVQGFETAALTNIMKIFTFIGSRNATIPIAIITMFILYKVLHHRFELILLIITLLGSPILNKLLKNFFHRARPDLHRLIEIGGYSFPSGHAMNAMTLYGILTYLLWKHAANRLHRTVLLACSFMMIFMIGISRIYLGVHYPSDIIAGYAAGFLWIIVTINVYTVFQKI